MVMMVMIMIIIPPIIMMMIAKIRRRRRRTIIRGKATKSATIIFNHKMPFSFSPMRLNNFTVLYTVPHESLKSIMF